MTSFATLPFAEQLARIEAAVEGNGELEPILREAGSLPDSEPLARLLILLVASGRIDTTLRAELGQLTEGLSDPALQQLLAQAAVGSECEAVLRDLVEDALYRWPIERISALALLSRWLRRRFPDRYRKFLETGLARTSEGPPDGRWLLFVPGDRLVELSRDPSWAPVVEDAVRRALAALAWAPKSISQANAEVLLAKRVYAEPGHFFFELLQNADDAGATRWQSTITPSSVAVEHDGRPFSFHDLVGVLSIGQTTKHAEQIGFFGVGFKSVYEICERPRIHSGVFDVEVAHVSIPRGLSTRPDEAERGHTVLVLPFSRCVNTVDLYRRACAIPPETLLTLPNIRSMGVTDVDGSSWSWSEEWDGETATLSRSESTERRRYLCVRKTFSFAGSREEGRAQTSPVLVAVALDVAGSPRPVEGPTLYSFLPTAEHTGLRCLVHARFDVTLDRERLSHSEWNEALLKTAGRGMAEAVKTLVRSGRSPLPVLSSPDELTPVARPLMDAVVAELRDHPCLPAADGAMLRPSEARVVPEPLSEPLAGLDLGEGTQALAPLPPRERAVATLLGARHFTGADLAALVARSAPEGRPAPSWLRDAVLVALGDAPVPDADIHALALLPDADGKLVRVDRALAASTEWAELYVSIRPVVDRRLVDALPASLRRRIAPASFDTTVVLRDLRDAEARARLLGREARLLHALATLATERLEQLSDLPILRAADGTRRSIEEGLHRLDPALGALAPQLMGKVHFVTSDLEAEFGTLIRSWVPSLGLAQLDELLRSTTWTKPELDSVLLVLDELAGSIGQDLVQRLAAAPIFEDVQGSRRPLLGRERALLPSDGDLRRVLPGWPWITDADRPFVRAARLTPTTVVAVVEALIADGAHQNSYTIPDVSMVDLLGWIARHADELPRAVADRLAGAAVWLDVDGHRRHPDSLRRAGGDDPVTAFYAEVGIRHVAHVASEQLATALRMGHRLAVSDTRLVLRDLRAFGDVIEVSRPVLAKALNAAAEELTPSELRPILDLPFFRDERGTGRRLTSWSDGDPEACCRAGSLRPVLRQGKRPLLHEDDEELFGPFLGAVGPAPASAADLIRCAEADEDLVANARALREALAQHADELDETTRPALAALPVFDDCTGVPRRSLELCDRRELESFFDEAELAALDLEDELLHPEQADLVARLGLPMRPIGELLAEDIIVQLLPGRPLHEQPTPWDRRASLARLLKGVAGAAIDPTEAPLAVDWQGCLTDRPLATADPVTRALVAPLPLAQRLADSEWSSLLPESLRPTILEALSVREVAEALRAACPQEQPMAGHPVIEDVTALYDWLLDNRDALQRDEAAMSALRAAAVLPSQRGTLRAPKDLVLDPSTPDIGLDWGISPDVPAELASWLATTCRMDRRQRRSIVEHVLDGIDAAARVDDRSRAGELVGFLARVLGAGEAPQEELEERVRYGKVRSRLKVPVAGRGWEKPKRAWMARAVEAAHVESFCCEPPPRIVLDPLDGPSRALLVACGATEDLDHATVLGCLTGRLLRPGDAAHRSLARYVAGRALATPRLRQEWSLDEVRWVPDGTGVLKRPRDLIWPDDLARDLLGPSPERFPHEQVVLDLPSEAGAALGFRLATSLALSDVARIVCDREGTLALLEWLEEGLNARRFRSTDVRASLGEGLLLRDADGVLRPPRDLAYQGAHALFGTRRGDHPDGQRFPRLTRALGIPSEPDVEMILSFLEELPDEVPEGSEELCDIVPRCYERLGEMAGAGADVRLPPGVVVAGLRDGRVVLARASDPRLRMFEPSQLAAALPLDHSQSLIELLPPAGPGTALRELFLRARVHDLWSDFEVRDVVAGPEETSHLEAGREIGSALRRALGERFDGHVKVVAPLSVTGTLRHVSGASGSGSGGDRRQRITVEVDAIIHDQVLWLTPSAIRRPELIAPALEREPARRAAMADWLARREWAALPKRLRTAPDDGAAKGVEGGVLHRIRSLFRRGSGEPTRREPPTPRSPARPKEPRTPERRAREAEPTRSTDEGLFRPRTELRSQLETSGDWLARRTQQPDFGFAFAPARAPAPWLYAPNLITIHFDRRRQAWRPARLERPPFTSAAGTMVFRGRLPRGEAVLPVPMFGEIERLTVHGEDLVPAPGPSGSHLVHLSEPGDVRFRVVLGRVPDLERAVPSTIPDALKPFIPDRELPEEVLDFLHGLDLEEPAISRASAVRDFIREHYRYDPSYLEDPGVARWLTRLSVGRANAHVAALHAARDDKHLGAGVCYELNTLACELLRRAGVPTALATGWVLDGGALSEPDHLWCITLLHDARGVPLWVPVDASSTRDGRPLRVPRRPPGRFRAPQDRRSKSPEPPKWNLGTGGGRGTSRGRSDGRARKRRRRVPRAELRRLLHHLQRLAGRELDAGERAQLERSLEDPKAAARLLDRLSR